MEEIKTVREQLVDKIMGHLIKVKNEDGIKEVELRDVLEDGDIWFSEDQKPTPILSKNAVKRLMTLTEARVIRSTIHERQSDAMNFEREQVWMEVTIEFPDGTTNSEDGVANRINTNGTIAHANLPIMARKRAISRAFLQSSYIGLFDVYDEVEKEDFAKEKNEIRELKNQLDAGRREFSLLRNRVCQFARLSHEDPTYPNTLVKDVWFEYRDHEYMKILATSEDELVAYVAATMNKTTIAKALAEREQEQEHPTPS